MFNVFVNVLFMYFVSPCVFDFFHVFSVLSMFVYVFPMGLVCLSTCFLRLSMCLRCFLFFLCIVLCIVLCVFHFFYGFLCVHVFVFYVVLSVFYVHVMFLFFFVRVFLGVFLVEC